MNALPVLISEPLNPSREENQNAYYQAVVTAVSRNNSIMHDVAVKNLASSIDIYARMREPAYFTDAAHETKAGMGKKQTSLPKDLPSKSISSCLRPAANNPAPRIRFQIFRRREEGVAVRRAMRP